MTFSFGYMVVIAVLASLSLTKTALPIYLLSIPKPILRLVVFIVGVLLPIGWTAGLAVILGVSQLAIPKLPNL